MSQKEYSRPLTFNTLLEAFHSAPPEKPFVTMWRGEDEVEALTFTEFRSRALFQARYLIQQGIKPGDTVVLILPQGIPLMAAFIGAMLIGAVPSILAYPNFKVEPAKYLHGLRGVSANLGAALVLIDAEFPPDLLLDAGVDQPIRLIRPYDGETIETSAQSLPNISPDQLAFIQHSAGTTGLQKGVPLSHAAALRQINHLISAINILPDDRIYSWLPLYHDMGLITSILLPLVCHLPVVMQSPTDWVLRPGTMLRLMETYRCTLAWIPNFTLQFLARRVPPEERCSMDLSCVRALINCSEPVRASSMDEFLRAYASARLRPGVLQSCYAMAETTFAVTQSDILAPGPARIWVNGDSLRRAQHIVPVSANTRGAVCLVSSGFRLADTQLRILSESGEQLGPGQIGEIVVHCDSMFEGYYRRADLTAAVLRNGWYSTGDLGFLWNDELYVTGRKKDLIIVGGENIYPQDVEEIVSSHSSIYQGRVVAFGQYNPGLGTEEIVVVAELRNMSELRNAHTIERELRSAIRAELNGRIGPIYLKPPRWIVKSTAGKAARSTTREKLMCELRDSKDQEQTNAGAG